MPESVISIGDEAFSGCISLTSITIPSRVNTIGNNVFYNCSGLSSVIIPNDVSNIGSSAFQGCSNLISIIIPENVTSIGSGTFWGCRNLASINIPSSITFIGEYAFYGCSRLSSITIPNAVTAIGNHAFENSGLTSVKIPDGVIAINEYTFSECYSLSSVHLPNNLKMIKRYAFHQCYALNSINIPASVEFIYQDAFTYCGLEKINSQPVTPPFIYNNTFSNYSVPVNVPSGCVDAYKAHDIWQNFTNISDGNLNYQITVTSGKNGSVTFGTNSVTDGSKVFDVKEGNSLTLTITPATGYQVSTLTVNGEDVKSQLSNGMLTISNVTANKTVEVTFELIPGYTESIRMSVPNGDRTAIGYSSSLGLDFTNVQGVKAWIVTGFTDDATVLLSRVKIVPPNTGLYLTSDVAGVEVDVPTTDKDIFYANLLKAAVDEETIQPTETHEGVEYTNFVVGKLTNGEMGFVRVKTARTLGPNKSRLLVPSSYYPVNAPSLSVEFIDETITDIKDCKDEHQQSTDYVFDLQGRKLPVGQAHKGMYIYKGKKYFIK